MVLLMASSLRAWHLHCPRLWTLKQVRGLVHGMHGYESRSLDPAVRRYYVYLLVGK